MVLSHNSATSIMINGSVAAAQQVGGEQKTGLSNGRKAEITTVQAIQAAEACLTQSTQDLPQQVFEERAATFHSWMVHLCKISLNDSVPANHHIAEAFLALLNRIAVSVSPSAPQQVQHIASRGIRDWGIQTCTLCDKLSNSSDGSQLILAFLAFLRSPKIAVLLPNDALILWKAAVQELNTLGAQSSQSPHAARFIGAVLCASLNVLVPSNTLKPSDPQLLVAATHLSAVASALSSSSNSLSHFLSPTFDHLTCNLMALSRLSEVHMRAPLSFPDLSAAEIALNSLSPGRELPACSSITANNVLDTIESQVTAAVQYQTPELQKSVLQSACVTLGSFRDLLAAVTANSGNDIRSRLRSMLLLVSKHASGTLKPQNSSSNGALQRGVANWGWNCTEKRAVSARRASGAADAAEAALLLCQQLSKALALCSVTRSPAHKISSPFAVVPSNTTGASHCEQIAAILTLGHMAVLCDGHPDAVTQAVAHSVLSDLSMALSSASSGSPAAQNYSPKAYACIVRTLGQTVVPLTVNGAPHAYRQATTMLLQAYINRSSPLADMLLHHTSTHPSNEAGAVADALEAVANQAHLLSPSLAVDYSRKLLALFSDFTMACRPLQNGVPLDSVALLPALAAACTAARACAAHGAPSSTLSRPMENHSLNTMAMSSLPPGSNPASPRPVSIASSTATTTGGSFVLSKLDAMRAPDTVTTRLFRNVWLYCGLLNLRRQPAPKALQAWPHADRCLGALGKLAAATPVLLYGSGSVKRAEAEQRVLLELQPHLSAAGSAGQPAAVAETLRSLLSHSSNSSSGHSSQARNVPDIPNSNPSNAYLLAIAALETSRAESGPLSDDESAPTPLIHALTYEASAEPRTIERGVFTALSQTSFRRTVERLLCTVPNSASSTSRKVGISPHMFRDNPPPLEREAFSKLEHIATTLIASVAFKGVKGKAADAPVTTTHTDELLEGLVDACPSLLVSPRCIQAWLEQENTPEVQKQVQNWIKRGSQVAPAHLEHLLHHFLISSAVEAHPEQQASSALAHSAGLLDTVAEGSTKSLIGDVSTGALTALHAKSVATGRIAGMREFIQDADDRVAAQIAATCSNGGDWGPGEQQTCMTAAALVVAKVRACGGAVVPLSVLKGICALPAQHFNGTAMRDIVFAWHWIVATGKHARERLLASTASAWAHVAQKGIGLFSGVWSPQAAPLSSGDLREWDAHAEDASLISALHAHHLWTLSLLEFWEASKHELDPAQESGVIFKVFRSISGSVAQAPHAICTHQLARVPLFRLLSLTARFIAHVKSSSARSGKPPRISVATGGFNDGVKDLLQGALTAGLLSFQRGREVTFSATEHCLGPRAAGKALLCFLADVEELEAGAPEVCRLVRPLLEALKLFVSSELHLQKVLIAPGDKTVTLAPPPVSAITTALDTCWRLSPALAHALVLRYPNAGEARSQLHNLTYQTAGKPETLAWPQGALRYADACHAMGEKPTHLDNWAPAGLGEAMMMLTKPLGRTSEVRKYVLKCLAQASDDELVFWLPQIVQSLRTDSNDTSSLRQFLLDTATDPKRWMLLHKLVWALETEEKPGEAEFNPEVKRSGWQPPSDNGLWTPCATLKSQILNHLPDASRAYFEAEHGTFQQVTDISGILKPVPKEKRPDKIAAEASKISIPREDLYLPVDVHKRLAGIIPTSGRAMQSAAKTPILLAFDVEVLPVHSHEVRTQGGALVKQACIFKVGDDCRQDVLALQIITILRNAYKRAGLPLYLFPYGVLPTGYERGIIEVVPNAKSRAGLGEMTDAGLYEIFQSRYGAPGTPAFEAARRAFVLSEAGYAIASYILQSKDRHNGNILIDGDGRLVHIDFGFIFEISPGGNIGFEDAAFKFSHEMAQLIDPGGQRASAQYKEFKELCVKGFLAARTVAEDILAVAELMAHSGLPCYGRGKPLEHLRDRFKLESTPEEAAAFMRGAVDMAHTRWRTSFYDYIQILQNDIPF